MAAATAAHALAASSRTRLTAPVIKELVLTCSDGIRLAAQSWKKQPAEATASDTSKQDTHTHRILCLHGWMDNCRTFYQLAPRLVENIDGVEVVALDLPGHGHSDHKSDDGPPVLLSEAAFYVAEAIEQLQWQSEPFTLIGHSMGAGIGCLYTAAFPEQVAQLVLLEGVAPLSRPASDIAKHVRAHVRRRQLGLAQLKSGTRGPRIYPDLASAVATRQQTAENFPGDQYLSQQAAQEMVQRGSRPAPDDSDGIQFRHDHRLQWPSVQYFTPEQASALYTDIRCPTALIMADDGWPFAESSMMEGCLDLLQPSLYKKLPGSHHFHADPDTASAVADQVIQFLNDEYAQAQETDNERKTG